MNDLFYLAKPFVQSLFFEDVVEWLDQSDIRYTPKVKFTGLSGFDHLFDFVVPKSPRKQPERIIQAITRPTRDQAESFIYAWTDTREVRPADSRAYALLNDIDQVVSSSVMDALSKYGIEPVRFSERAGVAAQLAA